MRVHSADLCLLLGALLGLARTTGAITCNFGDQASVTADFPARSSVCDAGADGTCFELRVKDWESKAGFLELHFGCGECGTIDKDKMECIECKSDLCNGVYGGEIRQNISQYKLCIVSVKSENGTTEEMFRCPRGQNCTSSVEPDFPNQVVFGCQKHCQIQNWTNCVDCDEDLCNSGTHHNKRSNQLSNAVPKPVRVRDASDMTSSSGAARPAAVVTAFAVVAVQALARLWQLPSRHCC